MLVFSPTSKCILQANELCCYCDACGLAIDVTLKVSPGVVVVASAAASIYSTAE